MHFYAADFPVESQKANLPEGTEERLTPVNASEIGSDLPTQAEAQLGQEEGVPGPAQVPPGLLPLHTEVEAKAPGAFAESPGTGQELSAASNRVSEAPTSQEALPSTDQGSSFSGPDPQPSEAGVKLSPGLPAQAKAAHGGGETPAR